MKITKKQLRKLVRKSILKEYMPPVNRNGPPPKDSSWREFADAMDIGVLDLDDMAYELGFSDFRDMDISIAPGDLAQRGPDLFVQAAQNSSMVAMDMNANQILSFANMPGMV